MTADGYFRTDDIAVMGEDEYLRILDRKKDVILVFGFNVYPNEIEALVTKIPGVMECACVGVADPQSGEAVRLFVVRIDESLDGEQIRDYCPPTWPPTRPPSPWNFSKPCPSRW